MLQVQLTTNDTLSALGKGKAVNQLVLMCPNAHLIGGSLPFSMLDHIALLITMYYYCTAMLYAVFTYLISAM